MLADWLCFFTPLAGFAAAYVLEAPAVFAVARGRS